MSYNYDYGYPDAGLTTLVASLNVGYYLVCLAVAVLTIIALWKIYEKAGEQGWKCLIPFYSDYILYKIAWKTKMFWVSLILGVVSFIALIFGVSAIVGGAYYESSAPVMGGAIALILGIALLIAIFVIKVILYINLAKSFGQSGAFAVGLILVNTIFILILGLGSYTYVGPEGIPAAAAPAADASVQQ